MSAINDLARYAFELFRPPRKWTVSEWADANRFLVSSNGAKQGRWRTDKAPYQREIMDAFVDPFVSEIVIMSSAQVGKSEIELNMLGYAIDADPGPILYVQPTKDAAEEYSKRRIAPMIANTRCLREKVHQAKGRDSANTIFIKYFPGGSLNIVGAGSPADLSSKPIRYVFMDETDRFPPSAGSEGDPQLLAERRTETFRHNRKIVRASTPTIKGKSNIEKDYMKGTREEWQTECPYCRNYSFIRFDNIIFDHEAITNEVGDKDFFVTNIRWRCPICERETNEYDTKRQPGKWVSQNPKAIENGIRSFRMNAFMSPWSSWKEICLKFLQAKDDAELLKVWKNTYLGESWEINSRSGIENEMFDRREYYDAQVPDGVRLLTMGIDTQDNRLEYEVVGWNKQEESWGIEYGIIPGRPDSDAAAIEVLRLMDREFTRKDGRKMRIMGAFWDSGGHYTEKIYKHCAKLGTRRVWAIKGEGGDKEYVTPMKRPKGDNALRFIVGVNSGKEIIMHDAGNTEIGPHYMHYPNNPEAGYTLEYFKGLISEQMVIHRRGGQSYLTWEKIRERNEPLDLRNYARAVFQFFNWKWDDMERLLSTPNGTEPQRVLTKAQSEKKKRKTVVSKGITV